jgi:glycosyltransferase involved in cell wall biosynthesis
VKILIVMDPGILVPPKGYGGHERLAYMFAREYQKKGHEVHLLVTKGSVIEGCTVHGYGKEGFPPEKSDARKAIFTAWKFLWKHKNEFDLIHNFGRLLYLLPILNCPVKKIMTYGREISAKNIKRIIKFPNKNIIFTGCSTNLISRAGAAGQWATVYNAIDFDKYTLQHTVAENAPLMFLGRIEKIKGCHIAIRVAKATGHQLIIAGNISPLKEEQQYYKEQIEPFIDGNQIKYVGQVDDEQKNIYLGTSKALLFPIEWNEPFGMVMVEAMACGTPVIGFKVGSVDEVIDEGITGYKVTTMESMAEAINKIPQINRPACCQRAKGRFNVDVIADKYLSLLT